jgi:mono/diheme cytochrome c family protein
MPKIIARKSDFCRRRAAAFTRKSRARGAAPLADASLHSLLGKRRRDREGLPPDALGGNMPRRRLPLAVAAIAMGLALAPHARAAETPLERGKYLMDSIVACGNCHTPKGPSGRAIADKELAGGEVFNAPIFHAIAPNITQDKETGIGNWTDDQIVNAIRNGRRSDGTIIGPPMPIEFYRGMADSDVRAIVAYLRTVKPVKNKPEKSTYKIPLPPAYGPVVTTVADVPRTNKLAYGKYLATGLGHCMDCHTPQEKGRLDMARMGAGGREFEAPGGGLIISANLTPGNPNGMAGWTDEQVKAAITQGKRPDRPLVRLMAFDWYKNLSKDDLDDLVAFLRTLKPVKTP